MSYMHPAALAARRKYWTRHDAWRFAAPGTPKAQMPGWLDPSATRVRLKEAQEEEARAAFEAELAELRASHERAKAELAEINYELAWRKLLCKFRPDQPRVPAGNPDGGQWTSGQGAGVSDITDHEPQDGLSDQPDSLPFPSTTVADDDDTGNSPTLAQMADERPIYDKADSALLAPRGVNAMSSERKLKYTLDDHTDYLGGVTVINEDRTILGRLAPSFGRSIVDVRFDAQVQTTDGLSNTSFRIQKELTPGSSITIPWKNFGLLRGPGQVEITASNVGALYTGVIIGAHRVGQRP